MKRTIKLIAIAGLAQLFAWTHVNAQLELLPEGFPTEDLVDNGDNHYTSVTFGAFRLDTSVKNRVIHTLLGPLVWDYDSEDRIVTLRSEWWGTLYSTLPTESSTLGFTWPYLLSERTESIYIVDVSGSTDTPFFNHTRAQDPNATPPFHVKSIGIPLENAEAFYLHAESEIVRMQQTIQVIRVLRDQLAGMSVAIGSDNIEKQRLLAIEEFEKIGNYYGAFQFYKQRARLAHRFVDDTTENYESRLTRAEWFGAQVESLAAMADALMADAQKALFEEIDGNNGVFGKKLNERTALIVAEQQRKAEEEAAKNKPTPSTPPTRPTTPTTPTRPTTPTTPITGGTPFTGTGGMFKGESLKLIIDDSLQGSTVGQQNGGSFSKEGYRPGRGYRHILYRVETIREGYVEFEARGIPGSFPRDTDHAFFVQYDARGISEPIQYQNDFKQNHYRWNVHYRQNRASMKCVLVTAKESTRNASRAVYGGNHHNRDWFSEPTGNGIRFDPGQWYKFRVEWRNKNFRVYINDNLMWSTTGPYDYAPVQHRMMLGSGPDKYNSFVDGIVYRNFKAFKFR